MLRFGLVRCGLASCSSTLGLHWAIVVTATLWLSFFLLATGRSKYSCTRCDQNDGRQALDCHIHSQYLKTYPV